MSRNLGSLTLDLVARTGGFEEGMARAERISKQKSEAIADNARKMGAALGAVFGTISAGAVFTRFVENTRNAEREQAQLTAVLLSTGQAAGYTRDQLNAMADDLAGKTIFSGGEITEAQTALLAFTGIVGDQFPQALQAAADMASRTGMTIMSAAETIGRALDVPSQGMAALSRQGFRFTEDQKLIVKQLEETGRAAEAQAMILDALTGTYGGAASSARDTFGGALTGLRNTLDDLLTGEQGSLNAATEAINAISDALASPEARVAISALADGAKILALVLGAQLVGAATATAVSFGVAQVQTYRLQVALAAMGGVSATAATGMLAAGAAARTMAAGMALLGGPAGVAVLGATGLYLLATHGSEASREMEEVARQSRLAGEELRNLAPDAVAQNIQTLTNHIDDLNKKLEILRSQPGSGRGGKKNTYAIAEAKRDLEAAESLRDAAFAQQQAQTALRSGDERSREQQKAAADQEAKRAEAIRAAGEEQKRLARERDQEAASLQRAYDSISDRMREQIQLYGEVSNVARLRYDMEYGDLIKLGEKQKEQLLGQAGVLDSIIQQQQGEAFQQETAGRLNAMRERYAQESAVIEEGRRKRLDQLDQYNAFEMLQEGEYAELRRQIELEAQEAQAGVRDARLASAQDMFGSLSQIAEDFAGKQSGIYRAMFMVEKASAIARSILAIQTGIAQAAALPFPGNLAAMATVASATAGIVSTITSVQASFDGGGFTGYGPRSGGMDGKGGFLAMMHPNETVLDHTKGQGLVGDVQVVVNNAPEGTQVSSRIEDGRRIVEVMLADLHSDGPVSRGLRGHFGLHRQGR